MNRVQIGTIVFVIAGVIYAIIFDKFLRLKKASFYRGVAIITPGILVILLLYAWLILRFSILTLAFFTLVTIVIVALNAILMKNFANWLSKYPSVQRWRKEFLRKRILKQQKRGHKAQEIQERGFIPDNDKLKEFGFSDDELRELGLLDK